MTSPVLVIHGTQDEVINFSHGQEIYERCPRAVEPLWVEVIIKNYHMFILNEIPSANLISTSAVILISNILLVNTITKEREMSKVN